MTVKLNARAYEFAMNPVRQGKYVTDERDDWSEHPPSAKNKFLYGDFRNVHRCALLAAESRADQRRYVDIELVVAHLYGTFETPRAGRQ